MNDILSILWDSTDELHRRCDKFPPNPEETLRVFEEETQEFASAAAEMIADGEDAGYSDTCAEAADVIVTILATLTGLGIGREDFEAWCHSVARKNDAKTWDTHFINPETGKIQRKSRSMTP
jgi:NTP pyrophosphatase (non-canonical NTP hydrolase)